MRGRGNRHRSTNERTRRSFDGRGRLETVLEHAGHRIGGDGFVACRRGARARPTNRGTSKSAHPTSGRARRRVRRGRCSRRTSTHRARGSCDRDTTARCGLGHGRHRGVGRCVDGRVARATTLDGRRCDDDGCDGEIGCRRIGASTACGGRHGATQRTARRDGSGTSEIERAEWPGRSGSDSGSIDANRRSRWCGIRRRTR